MATVEDLRRRVQVLRDTVERMKAIGAPSFPDAVSLGFIVSKTATFVGEVTAALVPNTGIFIGIFNTSCPSGWENVTALNSTFPMGGTTYGTTGGASSHTHTYDAISSHTHGTGFSFGSDASYHTHSYTTRGGTGGVQSGGTSFTTGLTGNNSGPGGSHTHGLSGSTGSTGEASQTSASGGTLPPYIDVVLCKAIP